MGELRFNDNGTVSLSIDDETYTLKRPTVKQLWEFWDLRDEITERAKEQLQTWIEDLSNIDENSEEYKKIMEEVKHRGRHSYEHLTYPFIREAFKELGSKPLPKKLDNAPAELADLTLPTQILEFWQSVPLAHSGRRG